MSRAEAIRSRMRDLEAELAQIEQYGADEFKDGAVIRWRKRFNTSGRKYTYAALKAGGRWYLTNRSGSALSWDDLVALLNEDGVTKVKVATGWREITAVSDTGLVRVKVAMPIVSPFSGEDTLEGMEW